MTTLATAKSQLHTRMEAEKKRALSEANMGAVRAAIPDLFALRYAAELRVLEAYYGATEPNRTIIRPVDGDNQSRSA